MSYPTPLIELRPAVDAEAEPQTMATPAVEPAPAPRPNASVATPAAEPIAETPPAGPVAYQLLPAESHQLSGDIERLVASGRYRPLLHERWLQPLQDRKQAVNILIRGGEQYDQHYELEGSISIAVERYLHINTDLWFSRFASTRGMEQSPWPVLPTPPTVLAAEQQRQQMMVREFNLQPLNGEADPWLPQQPFQLLFDQQYAVEQTVVLRQHRRMRSNELHYLDHPLVGLLVKITPYEPEPEPEPEPDSDEAAAGDGPASVTDRAPAAATPP